MKKILAIIFLGLLWCNPVYSEFVEKFNFNNLSEEEKLDKLSTLKWQNFEDPINHNFFLKKSNAEIYILETEYYLKDKKDINQYSWWQNGYEDVKNDLVIFAPTQTIYIEYKDVGYVTIDDWKAIEPTDLINEMREIQEAWKPILKEKGANYVEELNWVYKPTFDQQQNAVYVSYKANWNGKYGKAQTMQTNTIVLGRNGYLDISFTQEITNKTSEIKLKENANLAKEFTEGIVFLEGSKHADYKSGDKVAALSIGGLVAGTLGVKTLTKVGVLAKFTPYILKFWWIILAPIAAIVGMSRNKKRTTKRRKRKEVDYD